MVDKINNRGQVTIFMIVGILVFVAIILIFYFSGGMTFSKSPSENPGEYLKNCMIDSAKQAENIILVNNGYPQLNTTNYILYNKEKIPYACTVSEYYTPCIPQEPAFFSYINRLMENKVSRDTESCLNNLIDDLRKKGYEVQLEQGNTTLRIQKEFVNIHFGKKLYINKGEESQQISNIDISHGSDLYDIIKLEQTIVNYESTLCEFNKLNWMKHDNSIPIFTVRTSDQTKIYTLRTRTTNKEIKFAIKTCVLPAGI